MNLGTIRNANQRYDSAICLPKFKITPLDHYISIEKARVAHKVNFKSDLFQPFFLFH
jgi:hypothetical protein